MQHRANRNTRGRHRRTAALRSHRAPARPLAETGRYAAAVALAAGVGVTAVAAAAAGSASPSAGATALSAAPASVTAAATTTAAAVATAAALADGSTDTAALADPGATAPAGPGGLTTAGAGGVTAPGTHELTATDAAGLTAPGTSGLTAPGTSGAATAGTTGVATAGTSGVAARIGGPVAGLWSVPQARKVKPLPKWVNPLPEATVTSCFGPRWGRLHAGVDLAAAHGTPIRAAGAGVVVTAGPAAGYGNAVLVDHGNGYLTHYGHMSAITVAAGQRVTAGTQLGNEGSTGHSTGPHLHFEVHQGSYQNPIEPTGWLREHGVDLPGCG